VPEMASPPPPKPHPEIRKLDVCPYVPTAISTVHDDKDFAGEFYPVEKHAPHAFSLVELIVVLGISPCCSRSSLPALRQARRRRTAGQMRRQPAQHRPGSPPVRQRQPRLATSVVGMARLAPDPTDDTPAWTVEMIPYLGQPTSPVYNCPSFPRAERYRNYFLESQWSGRSGRSAMKLSDIKLTGKFILGGDKTNMGLYPGVANDDTDPDDFGGGGALLWPWNGGFYIHRTGTTCYSTTDTWTCVPSSIRAP